MPAKAGDRPRHEAIQMSNNPALRDIESIDAAMKSLELKYFGETPEMRQRLLQKSFEDRERMMSVVPGKDFAKWRALFQTRQAVLPYC
jgi:hypothetical protein